MTSSMSSRRATHSVANQFHSTSSTLPIGNAHSSAKRRVGGQTNLRLVFLTLALAAFVGYPAMMALKVWQVDKTEQSRENLAQLRPPSGGKIRAHTLVPTVPSTPSPKPAPKVYVLTHQKDVKVRGTKVDEEHPRCPWPVFL